MNVYASVNKKYQVSKKLCFESCYMQLFAIICDEVIESCDEDVEAKLYDEIKTIPTTF